MQQRLISGKLQVKTEEAQCQRETVRCQDYELMVYHYNPALLQTMRHLQIHYPEQVNYQVIVVTDNEYKTNSIRSRVFLGLE